MSTISGTTESVRPRIQASAVPGAMRPSASSASVPLAGRTTIRSFNPAKTLQLLPGGSNFLEGVARLRGHRMLRHLGGGALLAYGIDMIFSAGQAFKTAKTAYQQADNPVQGIGHGLLEAGKVFGKSMAAVTGGLAGMALAGGAMTAFGLVGGFLPLLAGAAAFAGGHWLVDQLIHKKEKTPSEALRETVAQAISNPFQSQPS